MIQQTPGVELLQPVGASLSSDCCGEKHIAARCIDGNTDGTTEVDLCHSNHEVAPWIAVDYGSEVTVYWVEIYNRKDCCGGRTRNVYVRVSNRLPTNASNHAPGVLLGHFPGPGTDGQRITVSGQIKTDFFIAYMNISGQALKGRYVIVQMFNNDVINLKEVKSFGRWPTEPGNKRNSSFYGLLT